MSTKPAPTTAIDPRSGAEYSACHQPVGGGSACLRYTGHKGAHRPTLAKPISERRAKWLAMTPEEQAAVVSERAQRRASKARPKQASRKSPAKPPTEKQLAARQAFAERARARQKVAA